MFLDNLSSKYVDNQLFAIDKKDSSKIDSFTIYCLFKSSRINYIWSKDKIAKRLVEQFSKLEVLKNSFDTSKNLKNRSV